MFEKSTNKRVGEQKSIYEQKAFNYIEKKGILVFSEYELPNLKSKYGNNLFIDLYCPDLMIAIEINGLHHYEPINGNEAFKKQIENDSIKSNYCHKNNIRLLIFDVRDGFNVFCSKFNKLADKSNKEIRKAKSNQNKKETENSPHYAKYLKLKERDKQKRIEQNKNKPKSKKTIFALIDDIVDSRNNKPKNVNTFRVNGR